jgi:methyltransferase
MRLGPRIYRHIYDNGALKMWPIILLTLVTIQRLAELVIARRNTAALLANGGREIGARHYPAIVIFHAAWLLGLWYFARGQGVNWILIAVFAVLQAARVWVLTTLGPRWTTRIILMPEKPLVVGGPFKFMNHPNYAVVALEIFVLPMAFGLLWFAFVGGVINICLLAARVNIEEQALSQKR